MQLISNIIKGLLLIISSNLLFWGHVQAQLPQHAYAVTFKNKPDTNCIVALSPRSVQRRTVQGIPLDATDQIVYRPYIDTVFQLVNGNLHSRSKWLNHIVILVSDTSNISAIRAKAFVQQVKYVGYFNNGLHQNQYNQYTAGNNQTENIFKIKSNQYDASWYGNSFDQTHIVLGEKMHALGYFGQGKMITLLDEGFSGVNSYRGFDSVQLHQRVRDKYNFVKCDTNVYNYSEHGTFSTSTISGYLPGEYVGAAPKASINLYITEDKGSEQYLEMYNLLTAAERADSMGTDIITISLGYNEFVGPQQNNLTYADINGQSTIAAKAANLATQKGIIFLASAGNEGNNLWQRILTPGDADSAITVGNVTNGKTPASSSGYGPNGANHVKPNVALQGQPGAVFTASGMANISGTSISTPQLAGWVACLLEAKPQLKPFEVKQVLEKSAHLYPSTNLQMGYGVPNFEKVIQMLNITANTSDTPEADQKLFIKGNPISTGEIKIALQSGNNGASKWTIFSITGQKISEGKFTYQVGTTAQTISAPLSSGIYILNLETGRKKFTERIAIYRN